MRQIAFSRKSLAVIVTAGLVAALGLLGAALPVIESAMAQDAPAPATQPAAKKKKAKKPDPVKEFFANGVIPRLKIEIAKEQMNALRGNPRAYIKATVKETEPGAAEAVFTDVGVHLKGQAGSFRGVDDRPGLTLNFDKYNKGQRFHGLDKFHLNNCAQDGTMLHEAIGGEIMRSAGVPAARCTHARVWLNGRDLGMYVLRESFDENMLKGFFKQRNGNIYEGNFVSDIDNLPVQKNNDAKKDQTKLKQLLDATRQGDPAKRRAALGAVLDVDRFLTVMALEAMTAHWDGYGFNRNNYRLYHDPESDRIVFLPCGMDQLFGQIGMGLQPGAGVVARVLMEYPGDKTRYFERVAELRQSVMDAEKLSQKVDEYAARLQPALKEINADVARNHQNMANDLKNRIAQRAREIDRQLGVVPKPIKFDAAGIAMVKGWQARIDGQASGDRFEEGGKARLRIKSTGAPMASFRATVLLPQGKYVFEGLARTIAVHAPSGPGTGAGLRISGGQRATGLVGDTNWQKCEYEINVTEPTREVVLVCELRANSGEAQFDVETLRLRKR